MSTAARGLARRIKHFKAPVGPVLYWPNTARHESTYTPTGPVLGGRAKCQQKGHVPMPIYVQGVRIIVLGATFCSRCKEQV